MKGQDIIAPIKQHLYSGSNKHTASDFQKWKEQEKETGMDLIPVSFSMQPQTALCLFAK